MSGKTLRMYQGLTTSKNWYQNKLDYQLAFPESYIDHEACEKYASVIKMLDCRLATFN